MFTITIQIWLRIIKHNPVNDLVLKLKKFVMEPKVSKKKIIFYFVLVSQK